VPCKRMRRSARCGHKRSQTLLRRHAHQIGIRWHRDGSRKTLSRAGEAHRGSGSCRLTDADPYAPSPASCDPNGQVWRLSMRPTKPRRGRTSCGQTLRPVLWRLVRLDNDTGKRSSRSSAIDRAVEDPTEIGSGPLWLRGGVARRSPRTATHEVRNRVTLCRLRRLQEQAVLRLLTRRDQVQGRGSRIARETAITLSWRSTRCHG